MPEAAKEEAEAAQEKAVAAMEGAEAAATTALVDAKAEAREAVAAKEAAEAALAERKAKSRAVALSGATLSHTHTRTERARVHTDCCFLYRSRIYKNIAKKSAQNDKCVDRGQISKLSSPVTPRGVQDQAAHTGAYLVTDTHTSSVCILDGRVT